MPTNFAPTIGAGLEAVFPFQGSQQVFQAFFTIRMSTIYSYWFLKHARAYSTDQVVINARNKYSFNITHYSFPPTIEPTELHLTVEKEVPIDAQITHSDASTRR